MGQPLHRWEGNQETERSLGNTQANVLKGSARYEDERLCSRGGAGHIFVVRRQLYQHLSDPAAYPRIPPIDANDPWPPGGNPLRFRGNSRNSRTQFPAAERRPTNAQALNPPNNV